RPCESARIHTSCRSGVEAKEGSGFGAFRGSRGADMILDYVFGGAVTLFITAYLVYALLRPERF
ncbi:MAG: K(+)-transporting ATPase subunit F, partial [Hyphomicrobiaceae bacterium]